MQLKQLLSFPDLNLLPQIFAKYDEITAVYLYGSAATGKIHAESDLDLAIVPRDGRARRKKLEILTELARHGFDRVDLIFLDTDDIVMRYEAVAPNRLIYQTEDFDRGSYYSLTLRQYFDFEPYLRVQREAMKRRILNG